ncbi:sensor histidine kinase [Deinococcus fonticola]|uniref:sensor histidine kinase n=1 Tax=Deinococcus fonticola TaxID=2528713 RepID=UPI00107548B1|nr:sensor histidine kinase [Deinococcus fonticola]
MMVSVTPWEQQEVTPREGTFSEVLHLRTVRVALYIVLALPLSGVIYGVMFAGVLAGVTTLPVLVGAGLLLGCLWLVGGFAEVQRWLARLLGLRFARPAWPPVYQGVMPWLRATLSEGATYRALLFHAIQFPLVVLCWAVLVVLLEVMVVGLGSPLWFWYPEWFRLSWGDRTWHLSAISIAGLFVMGVGATLVTAGVLNLMGRMWVRLAAGLLAREVGVEAARREVIALRRAAGSVALGDDLQATLADLTEQARAASTARTVALLTPEGTLRATAGPDDLSGPLEPLPAPGEASVHVTPDDRVLAALPVSLPASAGLQGGTLRAGYAPGVRPGQDELAFLLSIADHAGTALHAAQLIERAGVRAGEQERARLARELHDSVAQALYGISLGAKTARATLERDPERTRASLEYTINLAEGGVSEMKALLFSLRPDALEEGGLIAALTQHARALEARHGLKVQAELNEEPPLTPDAQAAAYRVMQEALHNVVKHARATQVCLAVRQDGLQVVLTVQDDGRGFDPQAPRPGSLGQRSMRERAAGAGGTLHVQSAEGQGTTLTLTLPASQVARAAPQEVRA